jgi:uncharacterized membrane protein
MSGLLQFALSLVSLIAARLYDHWQRVRRLHRRVRKQLSAGSGQLRTRSAHTAPAAKHKRTAAIHSRVTLGERAADAVASGMGSWRFIIAQTLLVAVWIGCNAWLLMRPFDPYPFILLNLAFSTQAAYAAPILQMASNRQATKDRLRDDQEAREVDLITKQLKLLETINRQQLKILQALHQRPADQPPTPSSSRS